MMLVQSPSVETCKPYIGRHVCAVLHDGRQIYGTITGVDENGLTFANAAPRATVLSTEAKKANKQLNELQQKAKTSGYGYGYDGYAGGYGRYGYGYGYNALAWTSIALLFLIPFLFI